MRWNLGLAGLATSWGLIAVLAAAVSLGAAPLAFLRLLLAAATLGVVALVDGAPVAPAARPASARADRARRRAGGALVAVLRGSQARLRRARSAHLLHGAALPRGSRAACSCRSGCRTWPSARSSPADSGSRSWHSQATTARRFGWVALACGIGSAAHVRRVLVLSKRLLHAHAAPLTVAFWDCLVGSVAIAPALAFVGPGAPEGRGGVGSGASFSASSSQASRRSPTRHSCAT